MIDGHTHLEKGPLTVDYVLKFVDAAVKNNIDTLHILDHTHRFKEFEPIYINYRYVKQQDEWFKRSEFRNSLDEYIELIKKCKELTFPIEVKFGLEVCYQKKDNDLIKSILDNYQFDFLVGSVHAIDYKVYDSSFSLETLWDKYPVDEIYKKFYDEELALIRSDIFTQIGHPDQIKMLNRIPSYDLTDTYRLFASEANKHNILVESNTGAHYRYNHKDIGTNKEFLTILKEYNCKIITASDAHDAENVGRLIKEIA